MPDPSFVLVQVEGARERMEAVVAQFVGTKHNSATRSAFVQAILSALGLDRPGVTALDIEEGAVALRYRADLHGQLTGDHDTPSCVEARARADRLVTALAAAKGGPKVVTADLPEGVALMVDEEHGSSVAITNLAEAKEVGNG